jgi:hypothetical protein
MDQPQYNPEGLREIKKKVQEGKLSKSDLDNLVSALSSIENSLQRVRVAIDSW